MKRIVFLLILILTTTQGAFAIQETFGHDKTLNQPSFEDLGNQFYIPAGRTESAGVNKNVNNDINKSDSSSDTRSLLPVEKFRLKTKKIIRERKQAKELKKHPENFSLEAKKTTTEEEQANNLIFECKTMQYLADKGELHATGGVKLIFPKQKTTATSETMIYDQKKNLIKMINNVVITKEGNVLTGDYMQIDMNEEVGILDNMKASNYSVEMKAEKGYMYGDKTIQENGHLKVDKSFKIKLDAGMFKNPNMEIKDEDLYTYSDMVHDSKFVIKSNHIIVNSQKDHEMVTLKKLELYKDGKRVLKLPSMTLYTNKNQDYVEGSYPEIGSKPRFGMFAGPGFVFGLPNGATAKIMPILNISGGLGFGGIGRYRSATNLTEMAYGSAAEFFTLKGKQELDKNLYLQYGTNSYMQDGFLGSRWGKYVADLVYTKSTTVDKFLGEKLPMTFRQRVSAGYIQDDGGNDSYNPRHKDLYDKDHNKLSTRNIGTSRFRYMVEAQQSLYKYENLDKLLFADFSVVAGGSAAIYGTGDTQFIGRIGPKLRTQCKYWVQDLGYFQAAFSDNTPIPIYDTYRYGKSNAYVRESIRLHKLLMLSWYGSINLSDDAIDGRQIQESRFIIGLGPDDIRLNVGMDVIRQSSFVGFTVNMDAKDTEIHYDKLEIKNPDKIGANEEEDLSEPSLYKESDNIKSVKLEKCQVFDIEDSSLRMETEKL